MILDNTIEVCSKCHFRIPKVLGYHGTIKCRCGTIVYTTELNQYTNIINRG